MCPSDCSLKETTKLVGLKRVSSWGHKREPSACLSKRVARIAGLARVTSWGKAHCLALDEAGLGVGVVFRGNDGDEGRQDSQGRSEQKLEDEIEDEYGVEYRYTHFRVAACVVWYGSAFHGRCVRGVRPHAFAGGSMVGVIPTMEPTVKFTRSIGGHVGGL